MCLSSNESFEKFFSEGVKGALLPVSVGSGVLFAEKPDKGRHLLLCYVQARRQPPSQIGGMKTVRHSILRFRNSPESR